MKAAEKSRAFPFSSEELKKLRQKVALAKKGKIKTISTERLLLACLKQNGRKLRAV